MHRCIRYDRQHWIILSITKNKWGGILLDSWFSCISPPTSIFEKINQVEQKEHSFLNRSHQQSLWILDHYLCVSFQSAFFSAICSSLLIIYLIVYTQSWRSTLWSNGGWLCHLKACTLTAQGCFIITNDKPVIQNAVRNFCWLDTPSNCKWSFPLILFLKSTVISL